MNLENTVNEIAEETAHEESDVRKHVMELREYNVPDEEIKQSLQDKFVSDDDDVSVYGGSDEFHADELEDDEWYHGVLKVIDKIAEEELHESIKQKLKIGDESGTTWLTVWDGNGFPQLNVGEVYKMDSLVGDEYQESVSLQMVSTSEVEQVETDIEVDTSGDRVTGRIEKVYSETVLKRCRHEGCGYKLKNGKCREHGDVNGEWDMRVRMRLSTGDVLQLNKELAEEILNTTFQQAMEVVEKEFDNKAFDPTVREKLIGRKIKAEANQSRGDWYANEAELVNNMDSAKERAQEILQEHSNTDIAAAS
jgi:replication factor A1